MDAFSHSGLNRMTSWHTGNTGCCFCLGLVEPRRTIDTRNGLGHFRVPSSMAFETHLLAHCSLMHAYATVFTQFCTSHICIGSNCTIFAPTSLSFFVYKFARFAFIARCSSFTVAGPRAKTKRDLLVTKKKTKKKTKKRSKNSSKDLPSCTRLTFTDMPSNVACSIPPGWAICTMFTRKRGTQHG